ncbi:MAG: MBL fold metallo-hydrolase [Acidimicrobiales bacterium]
MTSSRELVVLGTASQVPTRHRNHNGYLLRFDGEGVLFDPGEGTQRQMALAGIASSSITRICLTHFHGDHCLGLAGVLQRMALDSSGGHGAPGDAGPDGSGARAGGPGEATAAPPLIEVCFPASGVTQFEKLTTAVTWLPPRARARPVHPGEIIPGPGPLLLTACRLDHSVETVGWRLSEPDGRRMLPERLEEVGVRGADVSRLIAQGSVRVNGRVVSLEEVSAERPGQSFAFVMDTRPCDGAYELADGVDMLVCESTYLSGDEELAERYGHMTARQAGTLARQAGARSLVLTHYSRRHPDEAAFEAEAREVFPDAVAARDLDRIPVPPRAGRPPRSRPQPQPGAL